MSLDRFIARMNVRARNLPGEVNRVKRLAALACDQTVVLSTPVDTGRARSNWIVTNGEPNDGTIEPYAPTTQGGLGETANANAALAQGRDEIGRSKPEQDICITNNLEYIEPLNRGHSAQAPAMFVEEAIQTALDAVAGAKIDTGRSP